MKTQSTLASFFPPPLLRVLVAAVPIAIVCYFLSGLHDRPVLAAEMNAAAVTARLQPVAHLALAEPAAAPAAGAAGTLKKGQAVYAETCVACHGEGIAGAPKFGDKKAWAPRIAQGFDILVKHALEGFTGKDGTMPPNGGSSFEDVEVARAVAYMADKAGASFAEPAAPTKK